MEDQDKPPLSLYAYEEIAKSLHKIDEAYWSELNTMRVKSPFAMGINASPAPSPPRLPEHLRLTLCEYARRLFLTESNEYPVSPQIELWLTKLAERVTERVMRAVESLDKTFLDVLLTTRTYGLSYHGLSASQMRQAIESALEEVKTLTIVRYNPAVEEATKVLEAAPPDGSESSPSPESIEESTGLVGYTDDIVEHRRKLLEDYKAATGNPPNQRIYTSENAGIYKPQFYQWRDGRLPEESKITKRFERFLRAKRLPVPKNSTS